MENFSKFSDINDLVVSKTAQAELLLADVTVSKEGVILHPVKCPAVGRKEDSLKDSASQPACCFGKDICKYFVSATFNLEGYDKEIICSVI